MMAVASIQIMAASLFCILYFRCNLWAPAAYKYHTEVRCGHDLRFIKDVIMSLELNHPKQLEVREYNIH